MSATLLCIYLFQVAGEKALPHGICMNSGNILALTGFASLRAFALSLRSYTAPAFVLVLSLVPMATNIVRLVA